MTDRLHSKKIGKILLTASLALGLSACVSTAVGVVVDTAIEVAKVPFKVGGAVIDVVKGDGGDKDEKDVDQQSERADK